MRDWTKRQWMIIGGVLAVVVVLTGVAVALTGGGGETAATTTTTTRATTTTTTEATTTTQPPPVYPLTGLPVDDPAKASRPALVVKIDNADPAHGTGGRPQIGINSADVVFEEMVEGSVTRFASIFQSMDADPVGPVRSARTTDVLLMGQLHRPLFAWSGANAHVVDVVHQADVVDVGYDAATSAYYRSPDRRRPYNLYSSTPALRAAVPTEDRPPPQLFTYRPEGQAPTGGRASHGVDINFGGGPGSAPIAFDWDGTGWARFQNGTPHVDVDGQRIAPTNLIVQFTPYKQVQCCDAAGFPIVEAEVIGEGDAWVFTAGQVIEAHWSRPSLGDVTTYTGPDGQPVGLTPGRTWVSLVPPGNATAR